MRWVGYDAFVEIDHFFSRLFGAEVPVTLGVCRARNGETQQFTYERALSSAEHCSRSVLEESKLNKEEFRRFSWLRSSSPGVQHGSEYSLQVNEPQQEPSQNAGKENPKSARASDGE